MSRTHNQTIMIFFISAIFAFLSPVRSQTTFNDKPTTATLKPAGSLLSVDIDLQAGLESYRPLWNAAIEAAGAEGHDGIAINLRAADLLTPALVAALESEGVTTVPRQLVADRLKPFEEIKAAAHAKNLVAALSLDGRLDRRHLAASGAESFAFAKEAGEIRLRGPVTAFRWADGTTSPVLAVNQVTAPHGLFLFNHDFGLRYQRLFSAAYLIDGNRESSASRWVSNAADSNPIVTLQFTQPFNVEGIKLFFDSCHPCASFEMSLRVTEHRELRGDWVVVHSVDNNESTDVNMPIDPPRYATEMQIKFRPNTGDMVRMREIEVWITNARGQKLNMAPLAARATASSIMNAPAEQMIVINNDHVYALADAKLVQEKGVMLIPSQYGLLCMGDSYGQVSRMLGRDMKVSWFSEVKEMSAVEAMLWMDVSLPMHQPQVRRSVAALAAVLDSALEPDAMFLAHVMDGDMRFDISPSAQTSFAGALGRPVDDYLSGIVMFDKSESFTSKWVEKPGALYAEWTAWRAGLTADVMREAARLMAPNDGHRPFGLLIEKPLNGSHRAGVNWTTKDFQWSAPPFWNSAPFASAGIGEQIQFVAIPGKDPYQLFDSPDCGNQTIVNPVNSMAPEEIKQVLPGRPVYSVIPFSF